MTAEELRAIACDGALWFRAVEECDTVAEFGVIAIAGQERTAVAIDLGDDVHRGVCGLSAKHPFDIAERRQSTCATGMIAHSQSRELDGPVDGDEHGQFAFNAVLYMFEHGVTETVPRDA